MFLLYIPLSLTSCLCALIIQHSFYNIYLQSVIVTLLYKLPTLHLSRTLSPRDPSQLQIDR